MTPETVMSSVLRNQDELFLFFTFSVFLQFAASCIQRTVLLPGMAVSAVGSSWFQFIRSPLLAVDTFRDSSELVQTEKTLKALILYTLQIITEARNLGFIPGDCPLNLETEMKRDLQSTLKITNHPDAQCVPQKPVIGALITSLVPRY